MLHDAAYEAFRSISAIEGNFARLLYLASMQSPPGRYWHWGLSREYGEDAVSRAFHHSHRMVLETVLQIDLSELLNDLRNAAAEQQQTTAEFVQNLSSAPSISVRDWPRHSREHFKFVLASLRSLASAQEFGC